MAAFQNEEALRSIMSDVSGALRGISACHGLFNSMQRLLHISPSKAAAEVAERALDADKFMTLANRFAGVKSQIAVMDANSNTPQVLAENKKSRNLSDFLTSLVSAYGTCRGLRAVEVATTTIMWSVDKHDELRRGETVELGLVVDEQSLVEPLMGFLGTKPEHIPGIGVFLGFLSGAGQVIHPLIANGDLVRVSQKRSDIYVVMGGVSDREVVSRATWDDPTKREAWLSQRNLRWRAQEAMHPSMRQGRR